MSARGDDTADKTPAAARGAMSADGNVDRLRHPRVQPRRRLHRRQRRRRGDAYAWIERAAAAARPDRADGRDHARPRTTQVYREGAIVLADYSAPTRARPASKSCEGTGPGRPADRHVRHRLVHLQGDRRATTPATTSRSTASLPRRGGQQEARARQPGDRRRPRKITTGNSDSDSPVFSADGRYLVFTSEATNLVADFIDGNGGDDGGRLPPRPADRHHRGGQRRPAARRRRRPPARRQRRRAAPTTRARRSARTAATCCSSPTPPT